MRIWNIQTGFLIPNNDGVLVIKSTGDLKNRIDNITITIDNFNDCAVDYVNNYWAKSTQIRKVIYDEWGGNDIGKISKQLESNIPFEEVEAQYVEEKEYDYTTGFLFWMKKERQKYNITKEGLVRYNKLPTKHSIVSNRWYIETAGEVSRSILL